MNKSLVDIEIIQKYLHAKMDKIATYAFEKQALNDPFIYDAVEGFSKYPTSEIQIKEFNLLLQNRVAKAKANPWYFQQWGIAASIILIIATISIYFNQTEEAKPIALNELQNKGTENRETTKIIDDEDAIPEVKPKAKRVVFSKLKNNSLDSFALNNQSRIAKLPDSILTIASAAVKDVEEYESMATARKAAQEVNSLTSSQAINMQDILSKNVKTPIPLQEFVSFQSYIEKNSFVKDENTGRVIVLFQIGIYGQITYVKVIDSLNRIADERAADIIKKYQNFKNIKLDISLWFSVEINFNNP